MFPRGKIKFVRIGGSPGHGNVFIGLGDVACNALLASGLGACWDRRRELETSDALIVRSRQHKGAENARYAMTRREGIRAIIKVRKMTKPTREQICSLVVEEIAERMEAGLQSMVPLKRHDEVPELRARLPTRLPTALFHSSRVSRCPKAGDFELTPPSVARKRRREMDDELKRIHELREALMREGHVIKTKRMRGGQPVYVLAEYASEEELKAAHESKN